MKQTNENPRAATIAAPLMAFTMGRSLDNQQTNKTNAKNNKIAPNMFPIILIQSQLTKQSTNFMIASFIEIKICVPITNIYPKVYIYNLLSIPHTNPRIYNN